MDLDSQTTITLLLWTIMLVMAIVSICAIAVALWIGMTLFPHAHKAVNDMADKVAAGLAATTKPANLCSISDQQSMSPQDALDSIDNAQRAALARNTIPMWVEATLSLLFGLYVALGTLQFGGPLISWLFMGIFFTFALGRMRYAGVTPRSGAGRSLIAFAPAFLIAGVGILYGYKVVAAFGVSFAWLLGLASAIACFAAVTFIRRSVDTRRA